MKLFKGSVFENLKMGLDTLWQHKLRSLLTVLGVVIGTMTVIVIAAFVSGIDARVSKEIESFGTNSIYIYKFDPGFNFNPSSEERMRKPLSYEDATALEQECPSITYVAAFMSPVDFMAGPFTDRVNVRYRDVEMTTATVQGASPSYFKMGVTEVAEGRYYTDEENERRSDLAVIGRDVANTLFPFSNALGEDILISGRSYRVIGVLAERDIFLVGAEDPNNENKALYAGRRHRCDEYHARFSNRTHQGNRCKKSDWRTEARYCDSVPDRGDHVDRVGRVVGNSFWFANRPRHPTVHANIHTAVVTGRWLWCLGRPGIDLWLMAGLESCPAQPN